MMIQHAKETTNQGSNLVRLVILSDTHNRHKAVHKLLPPPDKQNNNTPSILLHCGDFADRGSLQHVRSFCRWLSRDESQYPALPLHFQHVVLVDGNHDRARPPAPVIDLSKEFAKCNQKIQENGIQRQVHFLQDDSVVLHGLKIHGVSWKSVENDDFSALLQQEQKPDVLLSHLGPYFSKQERKVAVGLDTKRDIDFRKWRGSRALTEAANSLDISLVLSGHVHWGRGAVFLPPNEDNNNDTGSWFINAASTKPGYKKYDRSSVGQQQVTPPVIVYYDTQKRRVAHLSCPPHDAVGGEIHEWTLCNGSAKA